MSEKTEEKSAGDTPVAFKAEAFAVNAESGQTERKSWSYVVPSLDFPKDIVDFGKYWEHGDGSVNLVADDGGLIDGDVENILEEHDFRACWDKFCVNLKPGEWAEWVKGDTTFRVTAMSEYPAISMEKTRHYSDCLSRMQEACVKIYGVPMFAPGDVDGRIVYRPDIKDEIDGIYTAWAVSHGAKGVKVHVDETWSSADYTNKSIAIEAPSLEMLHAALVSFGVNDPAAVKVDCKFGDEGGEKRFVCSVYLAEYVE